MLASSATICWYAALDLGINAGPRRVQVADQAALNGCGKSRHRSSQHPAPLAIEIVTRHQPGDGPRNLATPDYRRLDGRHSRVVRGVGADETEDERRHPGAK